MSPKAVKTAETAQTLASFQHGSGNGAIASDDETLILEALIIASGHLEESAKAIRLYEPRSPLALRLTGFADKMTDLHARYTNA
jgi:hypothetical protein